jgi:methyltransferase (TIGR00027 family)
MEDLHPRATSLRDAVLVSCCQRDASFARLLSNPHDPYPRLFAKTHSFAGRFAVTFSGTPVLGHLIRASWQGRVPGGLLHFLARKRFVEDQVREAIESGIKQIVIFGSGYDSLGIRLAKEMPGIQVFEVDHPPTQGSKRLALEKKMILPGNIHFLPVNLRKGTLEQHLLQAKGYDTHLHVLFVAERVLPYLPTNEVDEIFNFAYEHGVPNSRFIFTMIDKVMLNDPASFLHSEAAKASKQGRPFQSSIDLEEVEKFLFQRGLKGMGFADDHFIDEHYLQPAGFKTPPQLGEMVIVAYKADWAKWMLSRRPQITQLFSMKRPSEVAQSPLAPEPVAPAPAETPPPEAPSEAPPAPPAEQA